MVSFADEVCGTLARLIAYVMVLALLVIGGIALWQHLPEIAEAAAAAPEEWTQSTPATPSLAASPPANRATGADHPRLRGGL